MKKILYFFVGCIIVGFLMSAIFGSLPVFPFVAKGFLMSVSNDRYDEAYSMLSKDYQQRMDLPTFKNNVLQSGLNQYKSAKWVQEVTSSDHKHGYLRGVITTKLNTPIEIEFVFVQVQGKNWLDKGWRINDIRTPGIKPHGGSEAQHQ
ncbi:MAG: hypothetical protein BGO43_11360 [Gammaproteobacteria bacterium 39-13]|nr:hypothetical protein [Gammaproteobacteria bacterium]OJV85232.1 MAG: hypothetical protein BGO43_11360 [Gammaproteobacteria bacterium 39-13]